MQNVAGRRDRVTAIDELFAGELRRGHHADGGRLIASNLAIRARRQDRLGHLVMLGKQLGRLAVVIARLERQAIGRRDSRLLAKLLLNVIERGLHRPAIEPIDQAQGKHVFAPVAVTRAQPRVLCRRGVHLIDGDAHQAQALERAVVERVGRIAGFLEVAGGEGIFIGDDDAAAFDVAHIGAERGRIHRDQHIHLVAGCENLGAGKMDLIPAHAGERAGRGADLGRKVGERADVVADHRRRIGELRARQLHAVAAVTGKPDRHRREQMRRLGVTIAVAIDRQGRFRSRGCRIHFRMYVHLEN